MDLMRAYPQIPDLERRARRRTPKFSWDYLAGGAGDESGVARNTAAFEKVTFSADVLGAGARPGSPDLSIELFGRRYAYPFGVAPIGNSGIIWPRSAEYLAAAAKAADIPFCLSTFATSSVEEIGPIVDGNGWFQLYPLDDPEKEDDLLRRAKEAGFGVLVVTVDAVYPSRRARDVRNGLSVPPKLNWKNFAEMVIRPAWCLASLADGPPKFKNVLPYFPKNVTYTRIADMLGELLSGTIDVPHLERLRKVWDGPMLVKGILSAKDALSCRDAGADGVIISSHGGRSFDAFPGALDVLAEVRAAVGPDFCLGLDSGIRNGTDIAKAVALGADFVLLGRAFMFAVTALGQAGPAHAIEILRIELNSALNQMGCTELSELRDMVNK